nr:glycosyltransferase family A protein [uncultured Acetatifactor sp.]
MSKILTICIAAYNVSQYVTQTLDSILNIEQIEKLDIIIVNDGSTDNTFPTAQYYVEKYPNVVKIINKENGGWGSTVNVGIKLAQGKYFKLLDGDDLFETKNLSKYIDFLEKVDSDIVVSDYETFEDISGKRLDKFCYGETLDIGAECVKLDSVIDRYDLAMHSCTVKTDILRKANFHITENCFYTDTEFMIKVCCIADSLACFAGTVYLYRLCRDGQSMSVKSMIKRYQEHQMVIDVVIKIYNEERDLSLSKKRAIQKRLINIVDIQYFIFFAMPYTKLNRKEIISFDKTVKEGVRDIYRETKSKWVRICRLLNFKGYKVVNLLYRYVNSKDI